MWKDSRKLGQLMRLRVVHIVSIISKKATRKVKTNMKHKRQTTRVKTGNDKDSAMHTCRRMTMRQNWRNRIKN